MIAPDRCPLQLDVGLKREVYNHDVTSRAQDLLREVLKLPLARADVAAELLASLDDAARDQPDENRSRLGGGDRAEGT